MASLSTAGAVPVKNEKGELAMQKVKVKRYVAGKRPDYAGDEYSESDSDVELVASNVGAPPSAASLTDNEDEEEEEGQQLPLEEGQTSTVDEKLIEEALQKDARWRRLMQHRRLEGDEDEEETDHVVKSSRQHRVQSERPAISGFGDDEGRQPEDAMTEEEMQRRRLELRQRALERAKQEEQTNELPLSGEESEDEYESEYEEYSESEEETAPRLKPIFVSKKERATLIEAEEESRRQEELEKEEKVKQEERRKQTVKLVEELIRLEVEQEGKKTEEVFDLNSVLTDDENEELAYEMWKVRELKRIKRDREEREAREREKAEIERIHNMTEEERREFLRLNPKIVTNKQDKGKYKFLQKYFHRGAFFLDQEDQVFTRNFAEPTLEDRFDHTILPKVMQVKNFGKAGRTKWTHLVAEDTTDFHSPWVAETVQNAKFHNKHAAASRDLFDRPAMKRRRAD